MTLVSKADCPGHEGAGDHCFAAVCWHDFEASQAEMLPKGTLPLPKRSASSSAGAKISGTAESGKDEMVQDCSCMSLLTCVIVADRISCLV